MINKEFHQWFYSADHRLKYDEGNPTYLAAKEAWEEATARHSPPLVQWLDERNRVKAVREAKERREKSPREQVYEAEWEHQKEMDRARLL